MTHRYQIKILSGPLAGRRLKLPEGDFTIGGADPDLDAALEGGGQATLRAGEAGVRLATECPCWLEGRPWQPDEAPLPLKQAIDIGGLVLMIGAADETLPDCKVPARRDANRGMLPTVAAYAGLIVFVALAAGGGIWGYAALQPQTPAGDPNAWLDEWKRRARQQNIQIAGQRNGVLVLEGNCMASDARNALVAQLRANGVRYQDDSLCQDELVRNVQAVLNLHGFRDARARPGQAPGVVVIEGAVQADARWHEAVSMFATMRGLQRWSVEDPVGQGVKVLIDMLRDAGLIGKLSVARERGLILITGVLDEGGQRALSAITQAFAQRHPDAPKTIFQNIPTRSIQTGIFPSPVVSFGGTGDLAFLDLANGTRLKAGSRLPAGHVIVHLDRNGIDLERDGELMHLPLEL